MKPATVQFAATSLAVMAMAATSGAALAKGGAREAANPAIAPRTAESGFPLTAAQEAVVLPYLSLSIEVFPDTETIKGTAHYKVRATKRTDKVEFDLDPRFAIASVEVGGKALEAHKWRNPVGLLTIDLPRPLKAGREIKVAISYSGKPRVAPRAPWDGGFVWSKTASGDPWIATAVQLNGCDLFWPCVDNPQREIAVVDTAITVPANLFAAGNGVLIGTAQSGDSKTYSWRAKNPNSYGIALNIAPYALYETRYESQHGNRIPIKYWHLPENADKAPGLMAEMPLYLDFFETMIGPYPFGDEKVGIAETPHMGMEHQTINAYGNAYRPSAEGFDGLMQHEFAHEWFANQLSNKSTADMWLHEGFGTYMQPLYLRWKNGEQSYQAEMWRARTRLVNKLPVSPRGHISSGAYEDRERGWGRDIYGKGAWILHTLREQIGDKAFFAATRRLVYGRDDPKPGNFKPVVANTDDFLKIVNDATGKDYGWFFESYLRHAELPRLVEQRSGSTLTLTWVAGGGVFPMPVEVRIGDRIVVAAMTDGTDTINLGSDVVHYLADPHQKILRDNPDITRWQKWRAANPDSGRR